MAVPDYELFVPLTMRALSDGAETSAAEVSAWCRWTSQDR